MASLFRFAKMDVDSIKNVVKFLRDIWHDSPVKTSLSIALRLLKGIIPIVNLFAGKLIIDEVVHLVHRSSQHQPLNYHQLFKYVALEMLAFLTYAISDRVATLIDSLITENYINACSTKLMAVLASMELEETEDSEVQDELEQVRRVLNSRNILLPQVSGQMQNLVMVVGFGASLMFYTPWLILVLIVSLLPSFISELRFNAKSYEIGKVFTPERREQDYIRNLGIGNQASKEVRSFGLAPFLSARYEELSSAIYEKNKDVAVKRALWSIALSVLGSIGYYAAYSIAAIKTVNGLFSIGDLVFLTGSFRRVKFVLEGLLFNTSQLLAQARHISDTAKFIGDVESNRNERIAKPLPSVIKEGLRLENVGFRYRGATRWSLRNVSFSFKPGETIAIVGLNGAGKTTLLKLLARLYEPTEGTIYIDNVPIANYAPEDYRRLISVIFQDYMKYAFTVYENIGLGAPERLSDSNRIRDAADKSFAGRMIERLPAGYQQKLGKLDKSGIELSGGQWQRLAVARAFMRNAPFIILDEPSSALDAESAEQIFGEILKKTDGAGIMLISHRLSTVRRAEKIIVLENGKVAEVGTHQDLLAREGAYARLFKLQAAAYA